MPEFLAGKVVAIQPRGTERRDDALAIGDRGGGAVGIVALGLLALRVGHAGLPEQLAVARSKHISVRFFRRSRPG